MQDRHIDVNALEVRRSLARSFTGIDPAGHAWRGHIVIGGPVVTVDVVPHGAQPPYVHAWADVVDAPRCDGLVARTLAVEASELVLGRFAWRYGMYRIEHSILAGTTMAAVEVQATVWAVGWGAEAFSPRLRSLLAEKTPPPPPPETPAARLRDAADHVRLTTERVHYLLDSDYGGFQEHPDWGFHASFGSAHVFVDVLPVLDDSTAVRASAPVVSDVDLTDELALHLLELSSREPFGSFLYLPARREVWFQHVILGDDLDKVEFDAVVDLVSSIADQTDDDLVAQFGGRRYADLG
jgi:hypothetical protein